MRKLISLMHVSLDGFCAGIHASIGGMIIKISANGAVIKA